MKFVLMLALLSVASCRNLYHCGEDDDNDDAQFRMTSAEETDTPKLRSSFLEKGSPLSPESATALVLPTAYRKVDLSESEIPELRSSFLEKGSPLSPESATALVLPTAYEKVDI
ncbi:uncharacterized protein LOC121868684 [Homarus americanus]|uniref:Uncharacterized protein n=1 Tax=Homarus americanus TaxID=6706 RepID=A0A8J5K0A3_HOMAM|nr:uncharacterized protein LOC121868682 [Homarus americanus]XP_042225452.1 uncharacterized protein LOC121868683 [Homarus americanus]XP_042225454.1 uncharacterized protein LOC121868684 [Homarus americanus]KAG7166979.1 hypothetical protein Hamer_G005281 [Homarus americanus]KAG7166980.1 hypothetical protein Hamer_G005282 [Homarus americanus]KAG7166981.1 hypothetical protein Hamer_G005283 [Homarus americanus]